MNVFDWSKLQAFVAERKPLNVTAGILQDMFWTGDTVYEDGQFVEDHHAFTHSIWGAQDSKQS
jgi:hypothetical protein